jgi:hypothetical protein
MLKTLDELLREEVVARAFSADGALYLRILLTDPRGWNVRNEVCHGVPAIEFFNPSIADRLIHSLLLIGVVRFQRRERTGESEEPIPPAPSEGGSEGGSPAE